MATFHCSGNFLSAIERLKRRVNLSGIASKASLITLEGRLGMAEDLEMSISLINLVVVLILVGTKENKEG